MQPALEVVKPMIYSVSKCEDDRGTSLLWIDVDNQVGTRVSVKGINIILSGSEDQQQLPQRENNEATD